MGLTAKDIWIIVPAYNEAKYVGRVLKKLIRYHQRIIFVDDGSTDNTANIAAELINDVLVHEINLGKGAAMKTGALYAFKKKKAKAIIFLDADDQHDPSEIKLFIQELKKGHDVVLGVRQLKTDMPLVRFLGNKFASVLINILLGKYFSDIPSGYKAFTQKAFQKIDWQSAGYEVETEIAVRIAKAKLDFVEIPISTIYHDHDKGFTIINAIHILLQLPNWLWR